MDKSSVISLVQLVLILAQAYLTSQRVDISKVNVTLDDQGEPKIFIPWRRITVEKKLVIEMLLGTGILAFTAYYIFIFGRYSIFQFLILLFTLMSLRVTWKEIKWYDKFKEEIENKVREQQNKSN